MVVMNHEHFFSIYINIVIICVIIAYNNIISEFFSSRALPIPDPVKYTI